MPESVWLTTGDVSKRAGVSRERVRNWADRGWLDATIGPSGWRLFEESAVQDFLTQRLVYTMKRRLYRRPARLRRRCTVCRGTGFLGAA